MKKLIFLFSLLVSASTYAQEFGTNDAEIISKPFVNKVGKSSKFEEYYLKVGNKEYFIKFCESNASRKTIKNFMGKKIHVSYKLTEGNWDICKDDPEYAQSRIGKYVVVRKLFVLKD